MGKYELSIIMHGYHSVGGFWIVRNAYVGGGNFLVLFPLRLLKNIERNVIRLSVIDLHLLAWLNWENFD